MQSSLVLLATVLLGAPGALLAQTGPWADGELIVRSYLMPSQTPAFFRIDPATGDGEPLIAGFTFMGWSGGYTFDSYRNVLLANMAIGPTTDGLYEISASGAATAIPGFDFEHLRGLASAGDGRVFFQKLPPAPSTIQWLDANNSVHTLMDATGTAPLQITVEHMIWHAPTQAIIAATSKGSPGSCDPSVTTVYRIPLSADGSKVEGGVSCAGFGTAYDYCTGLDLLPSGDVLMTLANASGMIKPEKLLPVNPLTLAIGPTQAGVHPALLHGGHWNESIDAFVVLDNGLGNVLRTYLPGEVGNGTVLPADVPLATGMGFSAVDCLIEVEDPSPTTCSGSWLLTGWGVDGSDAFMPFLGVNGCPAIGSPFEIIMSGILGQAQGLLFLGLSSGALPFKGGTLYMNPIVATYPIVADGSFGLGGGGYVHLPALITDPILAGVSFQLQAAFADPGAIHDVSLSNGVQVTLGS